MVRFHGLRHRLLAIAAAWLPLMGLLLGLSGCGGGVTAPSAPDGSPIQIMLLFDANIPISASEEEKADQQQVAEWIESDLIRRFTEGGYQVTNTDDVQRFEPGRGKYLLTVKIEEYVPASATPRVEAGLGAGTTIINIYAELFQDNHTIPKLRLKKGHVTARNWQVCAEEVTSNAAKDISKRIHELN
jgi:hypothetical protein